MKGLFGEKKDPDQQARDAIRRKKWSKAIALLEQRLQNSDRDFALWNLVGDLYAHKRDRGMAVEAWRRALDGYALEGMHENVLGIGRKILRNAPEEDDVHLLLAEAHLYLERHADCLGALRNYLKFAKHRSESDLRAFFKHVVASSLSHPHLLSELDALYKESNIEDVELGKRVAEMVSAVQEASLPKPQETAPAVESVESGELTVSWRAAEPSNRADPEAVDGMFSLNDNGVSPMPDFLLTSASGPEPFSAPPAQMPSTSGEELLDPTGGPGNDHYDLGNVYKEMKLWDAAIAEFLQARRDPSLRLRASLSLVDCYIETHDLQAALELLTKEVEDGAAEEGQISLQFRMGEIQEMLGNLEAARQCFEKVCDMNSEFGDAAARVAGLRSKLNEEPKPLSH